MHGNDSEHIGSKVDDLGFFYDTTQTADKFLVHWVLLNVVVSVFCSLELNDESMGYAILSRVTSISKSSRRGGSLYVAR